MRADMHKLATGTKAMVCTDLQVAITRWEERKNMRQLRQWRRRERQEVNVDVNKGG